MLSPCMVMTCYMLPKQFWAYNNNEKCNYNMYDYADLLIVDEAGQISVEIGAITFAISALGVKIGNVFGSRFEKKAQAAGGIILILLGVKILLEHMGELV